MHGQGVWVGVWEFASNVLLGSVYYLFLLRTKAHGLQTGLKGGSGQYAGTFHAHALDPQAFEFEFVRARVAVQCRPRGAETSFLSNTRVSRAQTSLV
jgi:hypothetical protein